MQQRVIHSPVIWYPQNNVEYLITIKGYLTKTVIVFSDPTINECSYFNVATGMFQYRQLPDKIAHGHYQLRLLSAEALPPFNRDIRAPFYLMHVLASNYLVIPSKLTIHLHPYSVKPDTVTHAHLQQFESHNEEITHICAKELPHTVITTSFIPIYLEKNNPTIAYLSALYHAFLGFNHAKLENQCAMTRSLCQIRAHFASLMLRHYGINAIKIYKVWEMNWNAYISGADTFHCAVLILDDNKKPWIWDPWVRIDKSTPNQDLIEINKWVHKKNDRTPMKILLANHTIVNDWANTEWQQDIRYWDIASQHTRKTFTRLQFLFSDALPNHPERPIEDKSQARDAAASTDVMRLRA